MLGATCEILGCAPNELSKRKISYEEMIFLTKWYAISRGAETGSAGWKGKPRGKAPSPYKPTRRRGRRR